MIRKSRFAQLLIKKEVVGEKTIEKALEIQADEESTNQRTLGEILVTEFKIDHDKIYGLLADLYAFRRVDINVDELDEKQIKHTKEILSKFPEEFKKKLIFKKMLPYKFTQGRRKTLIVLAADPTQKEAGQIPNLTDFKKYEVVYCKLTSIERLVDLVAPQKNEFLDLLEEADEQISEVDSSEQKGKIDEYELDEEINKSLLVNLFEGCLIEAVRKKPAIFILFPTGVPALISCFGLMVN